MIISGFIAFFYPTVIKPQLTKLEQNLSDPVQKGMIILLKDYVFGFFYYMWYHILKACGFIGPGNVLVIEKNMQVTWLNNTLNKHCICYCY